jgi:carboxylesterase
MDPLLSTLVNPHLEGGPFFRKAGPHGVLLVHGFTATTAEVRPLAKALHAQGYTTAGPLLPGHGSTPAQLNRTRWQDWYTAVEECYQELAGSCEKVYVGGESLGGLLALLLASHYPEITGVMVYAPALRFKSPTVTTLVSLLSPFIPFRAKAQNPPTAADSRWQGYRVNPLRGVTQLSRLQRVVRQRLPLVRQPLLVVQGRLDRTIAVESGEMVYENAGSEQKELHWFEQSGHCVLIDCEMEPITSLTLHFLKQAEAQSTGTS